MTHPSTRDRFAALFGRHYRQVYAYAVSRAGRDLADDIVSDPGKLKAYLFALDEAAGRDGVWTPNQIAKWRAAPFLTLADVPRSPTRPGNSVLDRRKSLKRVSAGRDDWPANWVLSGSQVVHRIEERHFERFKMTLPIGTLSPPRGESAWVAQPCADICPC